MLEDKDLPPTRIEDVGEFGLIERLTKDWPLLRPQEVLRGVGDDAAVLRWTDERLLLVSTDALVEGVHFDRAYTPLRHLGYKAAMVNFSDIYAMNGWPLALTVTCAISAHISVEAMEEIYAGLRLACAAHEVDLIGGDMTSSRAGLMLSLTVLGACPPDKVVYRSGARPNDLLCVTGDLGAAYAGLQILEREKQVYLDNPAMQPDLSDFEYVVQRQLRPEARRDLIEFFAQAGVRPSAMMDVSDGLAGDVQHICQASGVGVHIYRDKLPIDYQTTRVADAFDLPVTSFALYGGEDYELLFTIAQQDYDTIRNRSDIAVIGYITETPGVWLVLPDESRMELRPMGFDHFKTSGA